MPRRPASPYGHPHTDRSEAAFDHDGRSGEEWSGSGEDFDLLGRFDDGAGAAANGVSGAGSRAARQAAGAPRWSKWLLYASMALGLLAAGMLLATMVIQSLVAGGVTLGGGNLFADTEVGRQLRHELVWGPIILPLIALAVAFGGLCLAALGIFRSRRG